MNHDPARHDPLNHGALKHEALAAIPAMVPRPAVHQQPLAPGAQTALAVPPIWGAISVPPPAAPEALDTDDAPPTITSLADLEALSAQPVAAEATVDVAKIIDAHVAAPEPELADFAPPAIACDLDRAPVLTPDALRRRLARDAAERLAALGAHRLDWALDTKPRSEARALAQVDALICLGPPAFETLRQACDEIPTPWSSWALAFAFACLEGREPLEAIADHVLSLGPSHREHRRLAAEAVAMSPSPHLAELARTCLAAPGGGTPTAAPFALELLSLRGLIPASDLRAWLGAPDPTGARAEIQAAAFRALTRLDEIPPDVPHLEPHLATPDPDLAWEAARALTLWGSGAPLAAARQGGPLFDLLGERAVELFVLAGHPDDAAQIQRLVRRLPMTESLLDRLARFGHPGTYAFLAHYLGDDTLASAAVAALTTLFGDILPPADQLDPFAWEKAIAPLPIPREAGAIHEPYRAGHPWSPPQVAQACASGALTRRAIELRLDELRVRARIRVPAPLWAFTTHHATFASDIVAATHPHRGSRR